MAKVNLCIQPTHRQDCLKVEGTLSAHCCSSHGCTLPTKPIFLLPSFTIHALVFIWSERKEDKPILCLCFPPFMQTSTETVRGTDITGLQHTERKCTGIKPCPCSGGLIINVSKHKFTLAFQLCNKEEKKKKKQHSGTRGFRCFINPPSKKKKVHEILIGNVLIYLNHSDVCSFLWLVYIQCTLFPQTQSIMSETSSLCSLWNYECVSLLLHNSSTWLWEELLNRWFFDANGSLDVFLWQNISLKVALHLETKSRSKTVNSGRNY